MTTTLILPGLHGSGPEHWQTWLESRLDKALRVEQEDWSQPQLQQWCGRIRAAIRQTEGRVILVAHSFGCLAAVAAAETMSDRIDGALLVAPASPERFGLTLRIPRAPMGFPTIVVGSRNDPWFAFDDVRAWASKRDARFVDAGPAGHINVASGFGPWPFGERLCAELLHTARGGKTATHPYRFTAPSGRNRAGRRTTTGVLA